MSSLGDKKDTEHYIHPFTYTNHTEEEARDALHKVLKEQKRVRLVTMDESYEHYIFISKFWRFRDDVEFLFTHDALTQNSSLIQVHSASRLGHSDFGVNRERIEMIRSLWQKELDLNK